MIERGEVDIAPCSFYLTAERKEVVDFSVTLDYAEYSATILSENSKNHHSGTNYSLDSLAETSEVSGDFSSHLHLNHGWQFSFLPLYFQLSS